MSLVSVHNEWDPLEEAIVGIADGARVPSPDRGLFAIDYADDVQHLADIPSGPYHPRVVEEANEDLEGFVALLRGEGVTVRRPSATDHTKPFGTPDWTADGEYNYCPRDVLLTVGQTVIEVPMTLRTRYFEPFAYREILLDYFDSGAKWFSAPKPQLPDSTYRVAPDSGPVLANHEPVFDAANVLRLGRDILYQVSCSGNEYGYRWLQRVLGDEYRVHALSGVYDGTHIDTTITPVRPGLVVLNPERVREDQLPPVFKNWDIIWTPEMADTGYSGPFPRGSLWMGMNFVMVNPDLAVVGETQLPLIRALEKHGVTVAPLRLRHPRTLSGGFHCVSLDVRRRGGLEDYS
ncbi:Inosamine-phosphate amidinotransferase 1 [Streptomyces lydicus]|nr:Inosamine-phosphate amidinotransferase 1 [Streptomyces lydicus]